MLTSVPVAQAHFKLRCAPFAALHHFPGKNNLDRSNRQDYFFSVRM
jgi:hypothetical protein